MKWRLFGRYPRLACIWRILQGHQVAYNIKIENGGIVLDGGRPAAIVGVQIIGPPPPKCPNCGTRVPLNTAAVTAPFADHGKFQVGQ